MKRKNVCIFMGAVLAASLLGGCAGKGEEQPETIAAITAEDTALNLEQYSDAYIEGEDALYSVSNQKHTYCTYGANTVAGTSDLHYVDKEGNYNSLCPVRGCAHGTESCPVWIPDTRRRVYNTVYGEYLYSVVQDQDGWHLYRYALKEKQDKLTVEQGEYLMTVCGGGKEQPEFMMHRGYLYIARGKELKRVELNPGKTVMTLAKSEKTISELRAYGNWLYFMEGDAQISALDLRHVQEGENTGKVCLKAEGITGYAVQGNLLAYTSNNRILTASVSDGTAGEPEVFYEREGYNIRDVFCYGEYLMFFECTTFEQTEAYKEETYVFAVLDAEKNKTSMDVSGSPGIGKKLYGYYPLSRQMVVTSEDASGIMDGISQLKDGTIARLDLGREAEQE